MVHGMKKIPVGGAGVEISLRIVFTVRFGANSDHVLPTQIYIIVCKYYLNGYRDAYLQNRIYSPTRLNIRRTYIHIHMH